MHRFNILSLSKFWSLGFWTLILFVIWNLLFGIFGFKEAHAGLIVQRPLYIGLTSGLVGYWSFDGQDMADVTAFDRSGNNNRGTLTNGPVRAVGKIGQALSFDGSNDYVDSGSGTSLEPVNITIAGWIKTSSTGSGVTSNTIVDKTRGSGAGSAYMLNVGGRVITNAGKLSFDALGAGWYTLQSNASVNDNKWHHVAITFNGSFKTLYIDGVLDKTQNNIQAIAYISDKSFSIGRYFSAADAYFNGLIDEVRIYNRALGEDEIRRLYNIGATLKLNKPRYTDSLANGLVGSWSFDGLDMAGVTAYDRSGNNNNGTLTNGPRREAGRVGQALNFDGSNDVVNAGSAASLDDINPTVSAWIFPRSYGGNSEGFIVAKASANPGIGWIFRFSYGNLYFRADCGLSDVYRESQVGTLPLNSWTHAAVSWDGSCTATGIKLYINRVEVSSYAGQNGTGPRVSDAAQNLLIGDQATSGSRPFNGLIDEVRIYNRALGPDEIRRLYNIGATLKLNKPQYTDSLANGLVGSWSFDGQDMSGNVAYDRSGNSNTGTLTNGPRREAGRVGQALNFDGVNDYVNAGSNTSLDNITVKTITAWIYPISSGEANNGRIVDKDQTTFFGWFFFVCSDSGCEYSRRLRFLQYFNNGTSNGAWNSAAGSISLNRWQHVAVIYDRSSTANDPTFYINGVVSTATETNTPSGSADNDANNVLTIGNRQDIDRTFNGLIDEVRIYNRALTSDEVKRLYNMGR